MGFTIALALTICGPLTCQAATLLKTTHLFDITHDFSQPTDVAVSADGFIYVVDGVNACIKVFKPDGTFAFAFGKKGRKQGEFMSPLGIDLDVSGNVYIADAGNQRLQIMSPKGKFLRQVMLPTSGFKTPDPSDVAVDEEHDRCYVVDNDNHHILAYSLSSLKLVDTFGSPGEGKRQFRYPFLIDLDTKGYLYIVDVINTRVQALTPEGSFVANIGGWGVEAGNFFRPKGVAIGPNNLVYVSDSYMGVIQAFDTNGDFQGVIADSLTKQVKRFNAPVGLYAGANKRLYVVEMFANKVSVLSLDHLDKSR